MFLPICICALDPDLYKNVKHFRFILGLLHFLTNENFFPFIFNVGSNLTPRTLNGNYFFLHTFRTTKSSPDFLCV